MKKGNNSGSTLVMVLIAILLLSMIGITALTQSGTELSTARNFVMDKSAFFAAEAGIEDGIREIKNSDMNPAGVSFSRTIGKYTYYTGLMSDSAAQNVTAFKGFRPPPPIGQSVEMGGEVGMTNAAWDLHVSSVSATGTKNWVRKQLESVVMTMVSEY